MIGLDASNPRAWRTIVSVGSDVVRDSLTFDRISKDEEQKIIDAGYGIEIIPLYRSIKDE